MKKYAASEKKIDYYQIEQEEAIGYFVRKLRAQKKSLSDTVGGMKLEDVPLKLMNVRTYKPGKDGKPALQTVDTHIGEDGGDFKFVGRCAECSALGAIFSYASHVSSISSFIGMCLEIFYNNSCMESTLGLSSQRGKEKYKSAEFELK